MSAGAGAVARRLRWRHVAFDLDGTLVDTRADLVASTNRVRAALGLPPLPADEVASYVGEGARRLVERALGATAGPLLDRGLALFMADYGAHLLDATRPYPGVAEALAALGARGAVQTVLTNKPEAMSRAILAGLGLDRHLAAVVGGDTLATRKPDPEGLLHLCARTGTTPADTLLVGDSGIDVRTARAAGTAFCGVSWGLTPEGMWAAGPERVIDDPGALLAVVAGD